MFKKLCILRLVAVLALLQISVLVFADVEDVIERQRQSKKIDQTSENVQNKALRGSYDGIKLGREEFLKTCAVCHGKSAKGDGLFSSQLKRKPSDLTKISKNNNGVFPALEVYKVIDGREVDEFAHGTSVMPVWGMRYSAESWFDVSAQHAETVARGKILELILYLNSIQEN